VHEVLYRQATNEVIVSAYRDRAIAACAREPQAQVLAGASAWEQPLSLRLMIGKPGVDVYLWQVESQLWNARFANPYLLVEASGLGTRVLCEYDIVHASASVQSL
jgi:hypothetical protein